MGQPRLVDNTADKAFLLASQSPMGGFGKEPEDCPDPYHSYLALAALSLNDLSCMELGLKKLEPKWNVSTDTALWLNNQIRAM